MKGNKVYTVYKTTNNINGKHYIGVHKTSNPFDSYLGSGKILKRAIEKYGRENFTKEIIDIFETPEEAFSLESQLVTFELIESKDSYNLKEGGQGGWETLNREGINLYGKNGQSGYGLENILGNTKHIDRMRTDEEYRTSETKKRIDTLKEKYRLGLITGTKGYTISEEHKSKIGKDNSVKQKGEKNSQFGKCWITKDGINKSIHKETLDFWIEQGYIKGREIKKMKDKQVVKKNMGM